MDVETSEATITATGRSAQKRQVAPSVAATVVICAYTEARWPQTVAAIKSVLLQDPAPAQVVLVIDHNPALAERARQHETRADVIENDGQRGLSGARNAGLRHANQPITVFLDDDARARPGWLASLLAPYRDDDVVATGGRVYPCWSTARPRWMPSTFDWVVGCSYLGLPETVAAIRNPIGANMSFRTEAARDAGGFDVTVGRVGGKLRGCEETVLAIKVSRGRRGSSVIYVPDAAVDHDVPRDRANIRHFVRRCWNEGRSKADTVRITGAAPGLRSERRHVRVVIPREIGRDMARLMRGDLAAASRVAMAVTGTAVTALGYVTDRVR